MSAPVDVKPAAPKRARRAPQITRSDDQLQLNEIERRLIVDFRRMSNSSRTSVSNFSNVIADKDVAAARKAAPALRLIVGGAR